MGKREAARKKKKREQQRKREEKQREEKCRIEQERRERREAEWRRLRSTSSGTSGEYESAEGPSRRASDSDVSGEYHSSRQSVSSEDADKTLTHPGLEDISEVPSRDLEMLNVTVDDELEDDVFEEPKSPAAPEQEGDNVFEETKSAVEPQQENDNVIEEPKSPAAPEQEGDNVFEEPKSPATPEQEGDNVFEKPKSPAAPEQEGDNVFEEPKSPATPEQEGDNVFEKPKSPAAPEQEGDNVIEEPKSPAAPEQEDDNVIEEPKSPAAPEQEGDNVFEEPKSPAAPEQEGDNVIEEPKSPAAPEQEDDNVIEEPKSPAAPEQEGDNVFEEPKSPAAPEQEGDNVIEEPKSPAAPEQEDDNVIEEPKSPAAPEQEGDNVFEEPKSPATPEQEGDNVFEKPKSPAAPEQEGDNVFEEPKSLAAPEQEGDNVFEEPKSPATPEQEGDNVFEEPKSPAAPAEQEDEVFEEPKTPVAPGQPEKSVPEAQPAKTKDVRKKTPKKRKKRVKKAAKPPDMIEPQKAPRHEPVEGPERDSPPDNFLVPKSPGWSPRKPPTIFQRFGQPDEPSMVSLGRVPQRRQIFREATPPREEEKKDKKEEQEIKQDLGEGSSRSSVLQIVEEIQEEEEEMKEEVKEPESAVEPEIVEETSSEAAGFVEENLAEGVPLPVVEALSEPQIVQEEQKETESADLEQEVVLEEIEDLSEMGAAALLHPPGIVFGDRERIPGIPERRFSGGISEAQLCVLLEDIPTSIEYILPEIIFESVEEDSEEEHFRSRVRLQVEEPSDLAKRRLIQSLRNRLRRQDSAVQSFDSSETPGSVDTPVSQGDILMSWRSSLSDDTGISSALRAQSPQPEGEELLEVRSEPGGSRSEEPGQEGRSLSEPREVGEVTGAKKRKVKKKNQEMKEAKRERAILFRRKHGRLGRRISVKTNCLRLTLRNSPQNVYQYNAKIERDHPKRLLTNIFRQIREEEFPEPENCLTFNGRNRIFNLEDLHLASGGTPMRYHDINLSNGELGETRSHALKIWNNRHLKLPFKTLKKNKLTTKNSKKWNESILCIDTVMREALLGDFWVRNVCYFRDSGNHPVRDREIITGYYQKVFTGSYIYLNVDLIKRPFLRKISLTGLMVSMGIDINHPIAAEDKQRLNQVLRGLPLFRSDQLGDGWPNLRRFRDILQPANEEVFYPEGLRTFVDEYYRNLNYIVRYPHLPTIRVAGEEREECVWPLEFCMILNTGNITSNLNSSQMKVFVSLHQSNARLRLAQLAKQVEEINYQDAEAVQRYGICVEKDFEEVQARVLRKCNIEYQKRKTLSPMDGGWLMTSKQFILPGTIKKLGVLIINSPVNHAVLEKFVEMVKLYGRQKGMIFGRGVIRDALYYNVGRGNRNVYTALQALKQSCDLVIVVLPKENSKDVYKDVKVVAERSLGMLTQCIREEKMKQLRGCIINGLVGQINAKLNGQNNRVQSMASKRLEGKVMVVGGVIMDGGRVGAGSTKSRVNVAGITATCDSEGFQHAAIWRYQRREVRTIQSLGTSVFNFIKNYQKDRTVKAPSTIIYYRLLPDEDMFEEVEKHERKLIEAACRRIHYKYKPKIIFIGTVRRHHVKFFPEGTDVTLPGYNVLPGTVVDRKIVDRQRHEFFMVSHCVRRGVAKPTKYILSPQCDVKMDKLQAITHHLTHLHALGYQTLAYVPCIHYAFRAAEKGKIFIRGLDFSLSNLQRYNQRKRPKQEFVKNFPMYFL